MDITLKCNACQTELVVDDSLAGQSAPCPSCGNTVVIPATATPRQSGFVPPTPTGITPKKPNPGKLPPLGVPPQPADPQPKRGLLFDVKLLDWLCLFWIASYVGTLIVAVLMAEFQGERDLLGMVIRLTPATIVGIIILRAATRTLLTLGQIEANTRPTTQRSTTR